MEIVSHIESILCFVSMSQVMIHFNYVITVQTVVHILMVVDMMLDIFHILWIPVGYITVTFVELLTACTGLNIWLSFRLHGYILKWLKKVI